MGILLISMCATLLVATMPTANKNREKSNRQNQAISLAQKQLEAIRGLGYANLSAQQLAVNGLLDSSNAIATNTYSFTNVDNGIMDNPSVVLPSGTGTVKIEQLDLDLKRVIVTVSWTDHGVQRSVTLGTLVANI